VPDLIAPSSVDAARIAAAINARAQALFSITEETAEGVERWFALPTLDPASDMRLAVDAENTTGAVALYERVGMHVVRHSDTWERAL